MSHRGLLLVLDGPLQSWGTQSRFSHRETDVEPSKSGVLGVVGAALGMPRDDDAMLRRLAALSMAVRVDRNGRILRDYHTAGGGKFRGQEHGVHGAKGTVVTNRFYLMDACFVVALAGIDHALIDKIVEAFRNPRWPLFLGRRSCVPAREVFLGGPYDGRAETLLEGEPWRGGADGESPADPMLRCVLEREQGEDSADGAASFGRPRADIPRSFRLYARRFDTRFIRERWLNASDLPKERAHVPVASTPE